MPGRRIAVLIVLLVIMVAGGPRSMAFDGCAHGRCSSPAEVVHSGAPTCFHDADCGTAHPSGGDHVAVAASGVTGPTTPGHCRPSCGVTAAAPSGVSAVLFRPPRSV